MKISMDYKYIEQLIERYFDCMTTLEEEQILRSFFGQEDVPAHLMQYRELFVFEVMAKKETLGEEFDARMMEIIEKSDKKEAEKKIYTAKGRIIALRHGLSPLFRAAAIVAVILSVGNIMEHSMQNPDVNPQGDATAINPYIKAVDVESTIQIKDISRAEVPTQNDSIQ